MHFCIGFEVCGVLGWFEVGIRLGLGTGGGEAGVLPRGFCW